MGSRTTQMDQALARLEARRISIENEIIEELEAQFHPEGSDTSLVRAEDDTVTFAGSPFTFSWYGIG